MIIYFFIECIKKPSGKKYIILNQLLKKPPVGTNGHKDTNIQDIKLN